MIDAIVNNRLKQNVSVAILASLLAHLLVNYSPILFIFAIGALVSVFLIFLYPESFFGLWMGGMFIPLFYFYPFLGSLRGWNYVPLIGVVFYILKTKKRLFPRINLMVILQFVFLALLSLGIFWSADRSYGMAKTHCFLSLNIVPLMGVLYFLDDFERLRRLIYSVAIGAIFMTLSGYYFLRVGAFEEGSLGIFTIDPIGYGRIAAAAVIFTVGYMCFEKLNLFKRLLLILFVSLFLLGAIFCGQRGVLIALIIGIFTLFFSRLDFKDKANTLKMISWFVIIMVLLLIFLHFLPEIRIHRYIQFTQNPTEDPGFQGRLELYKLSIELFFTSPIIGIGTAGFQSVTGGTWPHNIFLETMTEWGIVGLSIFCFFIFLTCKYALKLIRTRRFPESVRNLTTIIFSCFIFYLAQAQVSGNIFHNGPIWFFSGLICALSAFAENYGL